MRNSLKLFFVLMTSVLFFTSCEKEEFEVSAQASPVQTTHQVRKISFGELKRNRSAFETLKESRSKLKASSLLHRGVYSDDFGVFIDTTTILVTEKDGKHSITFRILNEEEVFKIKNLVLNAKEDGSYKAYLTEYILSQGELTRLANNEPIGEKYPSAVTDVSTYSRFSIEGDGAGCVEVRTYTVRYCNNSSGQTIVNTGTNGGNSSDCYDGYYEEEYQVMIIDAGCLSGGGGGGGNNPGGDIPGYNPGDGSGNSGGGSSSGGNPGNPDPGNNGNPTDPNQDLNDGYTPIITTPVLTIDKREVRLYNQLNASQQAWWNNASVETKNELLDYFNQNSPNNVVTDEAMAFILEAINTLKEGGEVDFALQIILDSSFSNDQRLKFIWNKINNGNSTINNYLNNFRPEFSVAHLRFKNDVNFSSTFSQEYWNAGAVTVPPNNYIIDIIMNSDPNLESSTQNFPNIIVALEIIHETIHAEMFRKLMQCAGLPHVNFSNLSHQEWTNLLISIMNNFPGLHDYYLRFEYNTSNPSDSHHEMMAQHYINIMAGALKDFDSNNHNNDFYEALSWIGLMDTVAWNNLSQAERNNIILIIQNAIQNESYTVDN